MEYIWKYGAIPLAILCILALKAGAERIRSRFANTGIREIDQSDVDDRPYGSGPRPILPIRGFPYNAVIVNEARWIGMDAVYLLVIMPQSLAAACIGGQMVLGQTFGLLAPSNPLALTSADRLIPALAAEPGSEVFLSLDKRNFRITPQEVSSIEFSARRALWTVGVKNSGTVRITMTTGRRRNLIILGHQDRDALIMQIRAAGFHVAGDDTTIRSAEGI